MSNLEPNDKEDYECPNCDRSFTTASGLGNHRTKTHGEDLRVKVECENCGDAFKVHKSRKDTAKYCSMECTKTRKVIECKQCGTIFEVRPSRSHKKFCSRKCSQKYKTGKNHHNYKEKIETDCEWCGNTLVLMPWEYRQAERHFCDQDCRSEWFTEWVSGRYTGEDHWMHDIDPEDHPMYNGGPFPYGPGFDADKKQSVRKRDGHECVICGMSKSEHYDKYDMNLHVHHIKQARNFDDPEQRNDMDNLVTLCLACHRQYEGVPIDVIT